MLAVTRSAKRFVAFYTADHSSDQRSHIKVFESKREAFGIVSEDPSNENGTLCALVSKNDTSQGNGGRCAMMCLKPPIYRETPDSNITRRDNAESFDFVNGLVVNVVTVLWC